MALTHLYSMAYEVTGAGDVLIEQDTGCGEVDRISLHPVQVQLIASEMGLLRGDENAWRRVESLERKLRVLKERCVHLEDWLHTKSDTEHADLSYEQAFAEATADLAREFCAELAPAVRSLSAPGADKTQTKPTANPAETQRVIATQAGLPLEGGLQ
jgi:hypothetical protein